MKIRLRHFVKTLGDKILSNRLYLLVLPLLFLLGNKVRRGSKTRFITVENGLYRANDTDGTDIFFCERTRFRLYHYPKGVKGRIHNIVQKYQNDDVDVRVEEGDVVLDIGANIGEFSCGVSKIAKQIFSIEPDPAVFPCLVKNAEGKKNISAYQLALSNQDGDASFYISTKDADSSLVQPKEFSRVINIRVQTLDAFMREAGLERVDFLKIEAEGWEPEILAGAIETLKRTRAVAVDSGPERYGNTTVDDVRAALRDAGFDVFERGHIVFARRSLQEPTIP